MADIVDFLVSTYTNLLNSSGFFTYRQVKYSKILHGARFALRTDSDLCFIHH